MLKITSDILKEWRACSGGFDRFNELFPDGADLKTAAQGLADDGHSDWSIWLYNHCRDDQRFRDQAIDGHRNTGDRNAGHWNTGDQNTGNRNTGDWNTGNWNAGDWNAGGRNTGDRNTGNRNTGDRNAGDRNTGNWNTGDWNAGDWNTGNWNTGHQNTGDWNTGDWNTGDRNTGYFNTITPSEILVFNLPISREIWDRVNKPSFLYRIELTWLVHESHMTDEEKIADPNFYMRGGQLKSRTHKEAWRKAWDDTTEADRRLVLSLPNFDADVFLEISGIDVRVELLI